MRFLVGQWVTLVANNDAAGVTEALRQAETIGERGDRAEQDHVKRRSVLTPFFGPLVQRTTIGQTEVIYELLHAAYFLAGTINRRDLPIGSADRQGHRRESAACSHINNCGYVGPSGPAPRRDSQRIRIVPGGALSRAGDAGQVNLSVGSDQQPKVLPHLTHGAIAERQVKMLQIRFQRCDECGTIVHGLDRRILLPGCKASSMMTRAAGESLPPCRSSGRLFEMNTAILRITAAASLCVSAFIGCAPVTSIRYDPAYIPTTLPSAYDAGDWATVLQENVRDGMVDYARLASDREALDRYLGLISVVGPESTPNLFRTPSDQTCYYINAYNACVLRAVLELYPTSSIHRIDTPRLDQGFIFRVDRRAVRLAGLRHKLKVASRGDVRVLFCLSEACVGSPALSEQSYRPNTLLEQMRNAVQRVLENPNLIRVDDGARTVFLWKRLMTNREACLEYDRRVSGSRRGDLLGFLAHVAETPLRERLSAASSYGIAWMPMNRQLNDSNAVARARTAQAPDPD